MADCLSDAMKELVGFVREFFAILHYFSDLVAAILIYNLIFEYGTVGTLLIWLVVALISAVIAELLKSKLPTPLRLILIRKGVV
jgi:hypothetical protein